MSDIFGISNSAFWALGLKNIDKALIWRGVNPKKINNDCNFFYETNRKIDRKGWREKCQRKQN